MKTSTAERNYHVCEPEALVVIFVLQNIRHSLVSSQLLTVLLACRRWMRCLLKKCLLKISSLVGPSHQRWLWIVFFAVVRVAKQQNFWVGLFVENHAMITVTSGGFLLLCDRFSWTRKSSSDSRRWTVTLEKTKKAKISEHDDSKVLYKAGLSDLETWL